MPGHTADELRQRIDILEAYRQATRQRGAVLDVVAVAPTTDQAVAGLAEMLNIDPACAHAVANMQVRRLTLGQLESIEQEIAEFRRLDGRAD